MMNKKHGIFSEPGTVRFERLLTGPAERIWDYLTKSELKARWLSAGDVEPKVSGKVIFNFKHSDLTETGDPVPDKYKAMEERSEEHTSELQSRGHLVCSLLLEKKNAMNQ